MLLKQIGIVPDQIVSPDIDETPRRDELPRPYAMRMARAKAAAVVSSDHLVLAADTVVACARSLASSTPLRSPPAIRFSWKAHSAGDVPASPAHTLHSSRPGKPRE